MGKTPKKLFKAFRAIGDARYTIVAQRRRTSDAPLGRLGDYANDRSGVDGYSNYLFFGQCRKEDGFHELTGPCFELDDASYDAVKEKLVSLVDLEGEEFEDAFVRTSADCFHLADRPGTVSSISLERNGKLYIELDDDRLGEERGHQLAASQTYFFMRDICHVHQHHSPTSDTILDVTLSDDDELSWKRETLYGLYRWIIQQKRSRLPDAYIDSKGVLAYAESFERLFCTPVPTGIPEYQHQTTLASLEAGHEKAVFLTTLPDLSSALFNRVIPLVAFAVMFLAPLYSRPAGAVLSWDQRVLGDFAAWFNQHTIKVIFGITAAAAIYNIGVVLRNRYIKPSLAYDVLRLLLPRGYYFAFLLASSVFALFLIAAWGLFWLQADPGPLPGP